MLHLNVQVLTLIEWLNDELGFAHLTLAFSKILCVLQVDHLFIVSISNIVCKIKAVLLLETFLEWARSKLLHRTR